MKETFEEVSIFGKPALFTPIRINRNTVPEGCYLYEIRHDDDGKGDAVQIARNIAVNHLGSLIARHEINLPSDGYLDIEPDDLKYNTGNCRNVEDYVKKYPPNCKIFDVTITETLTMIVKVGASNQNEAAQLVSDNWHNGEYVLDYDNFVDVKFEACETDEISIEEIQENILQKGY